MWKQLFEETALTVLLGLFALTLFSVGSWQLYKYMGPKWEETRRTVYEESRSRVRGVNQDLTRYRLDYVRSDDSTERAALRDVALQTVSGFPLDNLTPKNRTWINQLQN